MARRHKNRPLRDTVAIVGDGQTERIYFQDVNQTDRPNNLYIFPDIPRRLGTYQGVLQRAIQLKADFSRVYALIDMDTIISERRQVAYVIDKAEAESQGVTVLENNPCFELWLLLHFVDTARPFRNCEEVIRELRREGRLPGYAKTERYLVTARLYGSYKHLIPEHAKPRAERLEIGRADQGEFYPRAELYKFFDWYFGR